MARADRPSAINIYFDARWTRTDYHDGISRFGSNLVGALAELAPVTMLVHDERQLRLLPNIPHILVNHPLAAREMFLPRLLNNLGADVVYSPMQVMGTFGRKYRLIFTLHDTIYYRFPEAPLNLPAAQRAAWWLFHQAHWPGRLVLNQADAIATVSHTSRREILERRLTSRPVEVVYNAPPAFAPLHKVDHIERELVFMGTLMPYKNAELLIRALPLLPEYRLHLAGRAPEDRRAALRALADQQGVCDRVEFWNGASDTEYAELLSRATASVSASKAEGFGLPLIEAMASGVPFIATDMPIFREVGGDAVLYFDPDSPADFAARVREVEQPDVRAQLVERGLLRAGEFSWDRSAIQLLEMMRRLVDVPVEAQYAEGVGEHGVAEATSGRETSGQSEPVEP